MKTFGQLLVFSAQALAVTSVTAQEVAVPATAATVSSDAPASPPAASPVASTETPAVSRQTDPALAPAVAPAPVAPVHQGAKPEAVKKEQVPVAATPWYERVDFSALLDVYAGFNLNFPKPQNSNVYRAYDSHNGFSVAAAGIDATYPAEPFGGTLNLRFGPQATARAGRDAGTGMEYVSQAFVTWAPLTGLAFDLGKFDQPMGAESTDNFSNFNYTRGLVYWLAQPQFFTGARATYKASELITFMMFVANGYNSSFDNNYGKTIGGQLGFNLVEGTVLKLGYIGGPEQDDLDQVVVKDSNGNPVFDDKGEPVLDTVTVGTANRRMRHLADLTLLSRATDRVSLAFNGNYGREQVRDALGVEDWKSWYGVMGAVKFGLTPMMSLAARGEIFADPDGWRTGVVTASNDLTIGTATLTYEVKLMEEAIIRFDARMDVANEEIFNKLFEETSNIQPTVTLGFLGRL